MVANTSSVAGYFNFLKVSWMPSTADKAERMGKMAKLVGRCVAKFVGRWVAKLVAHLHATAALWVRIQT